VSPGPTGPQPDGVSIYRDVVYSRPARSQPLALDLYVPSAPATALCLYLHGGGWRVGSRTDGPGPTKSWSPSFFVRVAALGLAIASADYRLSGEARFPAQLDDVRAALRFLAEHRVGYGIATPRMVAWGVSAGGHLAALAALTAAGTRAAAQAVPAVSAVACWYAPTDLDAMADDCDRAGGHGERDIDARESQLIGAALDDRPDLVKQASPVFFACAGAPPFLLVHGTDDKLVSPVQSERLAAALTAAGASATVDLIPGATHMFGELDDEQALRVIERTVGFLRGQEGP
jgi:acetyl esterase/lipase